MPLTLSRRVGEKIMIGTGDNMIVVEVVKISGGKVRIGITAPKKMSVHRAEVYDQIYGKKEIESPIDLGGEA